MKPIEITILTDGDIRFCRCDPKTNERTFELLSKLNFSEQKEILDFLKDAEQFENILGSDSLCG